MPRPHPHDRVLMIAGVAALWMMAIAGRLAWLQLFQYSEYLGRAQRQQQRVIEVTPRRGAIYDRNLHPMAMSIPVDSCFAVPAEISDVSLASQLLSSVLGIPREVIEARLGSLRQFPCDPHKRPRRSKPRFNHPAGNPQHAGKELRRKRYIRNLRGNCEAGVHRNGIGR